MLGLNTIGNMSKRKGPPGPPPTPYSLALSEAVRQSGRTHEDLAEILKVTSGLISAWQTGRKPVPATRALPLASELGNVAPEAISADYAKISRQTGAKVVQMPGTAPVHPALAQNRNENDIDSLRWFASLMMAVMLDHRPAEAVELYEKIQRKVPKKFRDNGFLLELTEEMERHPVFSASAKVRGVGKPPAKPRS